MKITGIRIYKFTHVGEGQTITGDRGELLPATPAKDWLFLKIETDAGISGWGEGSGEWLTSPVEAMLRDWEPLLVGRDPLGIRAITDDLQNRSPWKGGAVPGTAVAAVDIALHDLAGKAWGVPVHTLLGGARRDRIRVYSGGDFSSPDAAAASALKVQAAGYAGVKGNPLEERLWAMDEQALANSTSVVAAIRKAAGPGFDIMLDTHGSPHPELSIEYARRVAPYRPLFLEEPCKVGSLEALLDVSRNSPVPIATGEKIFDLPGFEPLIRARAVSFLQPDIGHSFGLGNYMEIARRAEQQQILMAPHLGVGGLLYVASLHADAATPNFLIQESHQLQHFARYMEHDLRIEGGYVNTPGGPGLGVEVKEADIAGLPHVPMEYRQYRHEDGSWKGW